MKVRNTLLTLFLSLFASWTMAQDGALKWNESTHDFGDVIQGDKTEFVFTFENTSEVPISLSNVKASCGCTTPQWTKEEVAPGKKGEITVSYNSNRVGAFNKSVRVWTDTIAPPAVIYIKGMVNAKDPDFAPAEGNKIPSGSSNTVIPTKQVEKVVDKSHLEKYKVPRGKVAFEQVVLNAQQVQSNETKTVVFNLANTSDDHVHFTGQVDTETGFRVNLKNKELLPLQESTIEVVVDGKEMSNPGYFSKQIKVYTDEAAPNNIKQLTVNGNFEKVFSEAELANAPNIEFVETSIDGGQIIEGEKFVYDFKFKNTGKGPLEITSAKASCGCTATAPQDKVIEPGATSQITTTFDSRGRLGKQSKSVTVISNDPDSPTTVIRFTVEVVKDPFHAGGVGPAND